MKRVEYLVRFLAIAIVLTLIAISQYEGLIVQPTPFSDLILHLIVFAVLSSVALVGWNQHPTRVVALLLVVATAMEVSQIFQQQRTFLAVDLIGNILGVALGYLLFIAIRRFSRQTIM